MQLIGALLHIYQNRWRDVIIYTDIMEQPPAKQSVREFEDLFKMLEEHGKIDAEKKMSVLCSPYFHQ